MLKTARKQTCSHREIHMITYLGCLKERTRENSRGEFKESLFLAPEAPIVHFSSLSSDSIRRPARISSRSRLDGTEKNKIRLSLMLRMGLAAVTILFY